MASSQGDVRSSPMAYPAVRSLPKLPRPLRPEAEYLIVELLVRPVVHQAQSLVIALRSPATKRSSDLYRFTRYIHPSLCAGFADSGIGAHHCGFHMDPSRFKDKAGTPKKASRCARPTGQLTAEQQLPIEIALRTMWNALAAHFRGWARPIRPWLHANAATARCGVVPVYRSHAPSSLSLLAL